MQQAHFKPVTAIKFHSQADYLLPGHGTGMKTPASNDPVSNDPVSNDTAVNDHTSIDPIKNEWSFPQQQPGVQMALSVLANVVGGAVLLAAMFNLPVILAVIWGI